MGRRVSTIPFAMVAVALATSWAAADFDSVRPATATTPAAPSGAGAPTAPPSPPRIDGRFDRDPRTMADVHRLREQTAAATAAAIPELRALALQADNPIAVGRALDALARLGALLADEPLLAMARDARPRVRQEFAVALGQCGAAAVPVLRDLVHDADGEVQRLAIGALGRIGGRVAQAELTAIAQRDDLDAVTRARLRDALQRAANPGRHTQPGR